MTDLSKLDGEIPLGKDVNYSAKYDPTLLAPIPRTLARQSLAIGDELPFQGLDLWTGFELSWLQPNGVPTAYVVRFYIPADSKNIVESKSFKLYLNSYNDSVFASPERVRQHLIDDISDATKAEVRVELNAITDPIVPELEISTALGDCIDHSHVEIRQYHPDATLLSSDPSRHVEEILHSHLLKSNCPVTGQPDWATVVINYKGPKIDRSSLLAYIISFRHHQDFHEHCAERMFLDLIAKCHCESLEVCTRYTRRGGLDINPYRSTFRHEGFEETRLIRQ